MSKTPKQNITPLMCLVYNFSNVSTEIKFHVNKNTEVPYCITYNNSGVIKGSRDLLLEFGTPSIYLGNVCVIVDISQSICQSVRI